MSQQDKELVKAFVESDFCSYPAQISRFLHPEVTLFWNSSEGFYKLNLDGIIKITREASKSFKTLDCNVNHLLQEGNQVTIRFSYTVRSEEKPDKPIPVANFIAIWEIKDDKLYNGYLISQPKGNKTQNILAFLTKNYKKY